MMMLFKGHRMYECCVSAVLMLCWCCVYTVLVLQ
jgi:hypothetical protein